MTTHLTVGDYPAWMHKLGENPQWTFESVTRPGEGPGMVDMSKFTPTTLCGQDSVISVSKDHKLNPDCLVEQLQKLIDENKELKLKLNEVKRQLEVIRQTL